MISVQKYILIEISTRFLRCCAYHHLNAPNRPFHVPLAVNDNLVIITEEEERGGDPGK